MNFQTDEIKIEQPASAELYEILCGATLFRLTSYNEKVLHNSHAYQPVQISRSIIKRTLAVSDNSGITVSVLSGILPVNNELFSSTNTFSIRIIRKHLTTGFSRLLFDGNVQFYQSDGTLLNLNCFDIKYKLTEEIPKVTFTSYCNNVVYDQTCTLRESVFTASISVMDVEINSSVAYGEDYTISRVGIADPTSGTRTFTYNTTGVNTPSCILAYSDLTTFPADDNYVSAVGANILNGILTHSRTGKKYSVLSHDATNKKIGISPILSDFKPGDTFLVSWGCSRSRAICHSRFNNRVNFVGFPFIPSTDVSKSLAVT